MDRDEYIKRERAGDDERRRKLEEEKKKGEPVIEKSGSTHKGTTNADRFAGVKKSFREQGERFRRGWKKSSEEMRDDASYKVREKIGRLTPDEKTEKLKRLRQNLSIEKTAASIEKIRSQRMQRSNDASRKDIMNFGMTDPAQWYGISAGKDSGPVAFNAGAYENLFLNLSACKQQRAFNPASLGNVGASKSPGWNGNILDMPGARGGAEPDLKKVRDFYGI